MPGGLLKAPSEHKCSSPVPYIGHSHVLNSSHQTLVAPEKLNDFHLLKCVLDTLFLLLLLYPRLFLRLLLLQGRHRIG